MGHLACLQCQFNLIDSLALGQRRHRRDHPGLFSSSIQRFQHMRGPVRSPKKDALLARSDAHKLGHQLASRLSRGACKPALGPAARGERCLVARIEPVQSLHESRHRQVASRLPKKPFGGVGGFLVSRLSVPGVLSATEVTTAATTSSTASSAPTTPAATGRSRVCCPLASLARPQRWYAHACGRVGGRRLLGRAPRLKEPSLPLGQRTVGRAISMHASMRWYGRRATARATPCRKACATAHIAGHAACSTVGRAVGRPDGWRRWRRWRLRRRRRSGCTLPHVGRANTEAVRVRPVVQVEPLAVDCSDRCNHAVFGLVPDEPVADGEAQLGGYIHLAPPKLPEGCAHRRVEQRHPHGLREPGKVDAARLLRRLRLPRGRDCRRAGSLQLQLRIPQRLRVPERARRGSLHRREPAPRVAACVGRRAFVPRQARDVPEALGARPLVRAQLGPRLQAALLRVRRRRRR
mmetsp:Transcript_84341/g.252934  ORF Transcript_84341/g.252934 Transcript_84341/m.252934 type:complete len:465 (-) Transcript_84341:1354-2748(-)